jgi:tetratricopeptide (TPR) repeat protein
MARVADAILPDMKRTPWLVIAGIERERGRLEEAIRALEHAKTISMGRIPAHSRRIDAVIDQYLAILHADLGRHDVAQELIHRAEAELAGDPKPGITQDAAAALVYALAHDRDRALGRIDSAERGRHDVLQDGTTQRTVLTRLGRAALAVDEPERAEAFLLAFLELPPDPLHVPFTWYHLAGCRRRLGDEAGGRECDAKAASTRFGSRWERLARERLTVEGVIS